MRKSVLTFLTLVLFAIVSPSWGEDTPAPAQEAKAAPSPGQKLLGEEKFSEALRILEQEALKNAGNADIEFARIKALMGLGRYAEAMKPALALAGKHPDRPEIRFSVGECAMEQGNFSLALRQWAALQNLADQRWAGDAYAAAARLLLAQGKSDEAIALTRKGIEAIPSPPLPLLRAAMQCERSAAACVKILEKLEEADPQNRLEYQAARGAYGQAGNVTIADMGEGPQKHIVIYLNPSIQVSSSANSVLPLGTLSSIVLAQGLVRPGGQGSIISRGANSPKVPAPGASQWWSPYYDASGWSYAPPLDALWGFNIGLIKRSTRLIGGAIIQGRINSSEPTLMALSSATELAAVTDSLAESLKLFSPVKNRAGKSKQPIWILLRDFNVDGLSVANLPARVIVTEGERSRGIQGFIPLSTLRSRPLSIDLRGQMLAVHSPETDVEAILHGGVTRGKVLWFQNAIVIEGKLNESETGFFILDPFASRTWVSPGAADKLGVPTKKREPRIARGLSISFANNMVACPTLSVEEVPDDLGIHCLGVIGSDILRGFEIFLDYSTNTIAFKPYDKK